MISDSTILEISGTYYVRVPKLFADYYKLRSDKCKVEEISKNELKVTFPVW